MNTRLSKRAMKIISTLLVVLIILSVFWALQFVRTRMSAEVGVVTYKEGIQFMAADRNVTGSYAIQNESYAYKLRLDTWCADTNKTYPGAFAIVNPQNISLTIRKITVKGDSNGYLKIYLHKNMTKPCSSDYVTENIVCENTNDKQMYYDGSSIEYITGGWKLGTGLGYNNTDCLTYKNDTSQANATKSEGVWVYDESGPNLADNSTANFVWIEIDIVVPSGANTSTYNNEIVIYVDCSITPEDGPEIDFMACDRIGGGYVMTGYTNRTVKFNIGEWYGGTNKSFPGAFGIVNTESTNITVAKIEVTGDTNGYLRIYLHKNHTLPCNSTIVPEGIITEASGDMMLYYDGTTSFSYGSSGWKLGDGLGYNDTGNLVYTDDGSSAHAINTSRIAGFPDSKYYFWVYDESGPNLADNSTANFVWVEIDVVVPEGVSETTISGEITFYFKSI